MSRMLIVDGEPPIREALAEAFTGQGYEVDTAAGGEEALEKVRAQWPDLMLLDVRMPGRKCGPLTLTQAKEIHPQLEVIMVTAAHDQDTVREAKALGAADYVTKPFDLDHLTGVVRARLHAVKGEVTLRSV